MLLFAGGFKVSALNIHIIESQSGPSQTMDIRWEAICLGMGHSPVIYPYTHLDVLANFSSADILIVSSATLSNLMPFPQRVANIQQFLQSGGKIYLQSEYDVIFDGNQAFQTIVNNSGGFFSWTGTVTGMLTPNVTGSMANNYSQTQPIPNFWYGHSIDPCSSVEMFLEFGGQFLGCIFCHPSGGRISTTSDQDWTFIGNGPPSDSLMQNIVFNLSQPNYNCVVNTSTASINLGNDTTFCTGGFVLLDAGTGFTSYSWSTGATTASILISSSATIWVQATGPCVSASDTIVVTVQNCNTPVANAQAADTSLCPETCTDFTNLSVNALSYEWFFPGSSQPTSTAMNPANVCYSTPGTFDVTLIATNANGSDTLFFPGYITVYPYPTPQSILQSGDTLFASGGYLSYQWYYNGFVITGATDYFYVATQSGDYTVQSLDSNTCPVQTTIHNVIADVNEYIGMEYLELFPNPVENMLVVIRSSFIGTAVGISIWNVIGECILVDKEKPDSRNVDVSYLKPGIYFLRISGNGRIAIGKFVKK